MALVSSIERIRGHRIRIKLDDGSCYFLLSSAFRERPLQVGQEIDAGEYADWVLKKQYRSALDHAVAMLALRACSRGEIRRKLQLTGYSPDTVEMVLYKLESNGLLDDLEFARQWTNSRSGKKYGPYRIERELRSKGVSREDTEEVLDAISEEDQFRSALDLARKSLKKAKSGEDPRKTQKRAVDAIVRRGFSWETAQKAVDAVLSGDSDPD